MTRDEFRTALEILISDSFDLPAEEVVEELKEALRLVEASEVTNGER